MKRIADIRPTRMASAVLLAVAFGCGADRNGAPPEVELAVQESERRSREDRAAIRAGYLERLRLGLGSPFRLMDFALSDPRLDPEFRQEIASELLARTARGDLYQIDPVVLVTLGGSADEALRLARGHLELIENTIAGAPDPRAGELAVQLAYRVAVLEKTSDPRAMPAVAAVARLVADREVAARDARRIVSAARASGDEPIDLVSEWRRARRILVERPAAQATTAAREQHAIRGIPFLLSSIRLVGAVGARRATASIPAPENLEDLVRFQVIADSMALPPRSPLVVALRQIGAVLPELLGERERRAWAEFESAAGDEESFASRHADLLNREPALRTTLAAVAVSAAVGLRVNAQERVWYPGMESVTSEELRARYGLWVRTGEGIPERWVPFYLAGLDESMQDLQSVLPTLSVRGLTVEITRESRIPRSLASHSPGTRVLEWPVTTGPGTLAHEIAHDLDWQTATRKSKRARRYASDRARDLGPASFASALAALTPSGGAVSGEKDARPTHGTRPAEVLARTFDWFVVTRLAARGRWNGTLSSAQDELFTGHGTLRPPGTSPRYGPAVIEVLRSLVTVPDVERSAFLSDYGRTYWPTANLLLSELGTRLDDLDLSSPANPPDGVSREPLRSIALVQRQVTEELDSSACQTRSLLDPGVRAEYRQLVKLATTGRGRGAALERAEQVGGADAQKWMRRELYGPLWPASEIDSSMALGLTDVVREVRSLEETQAPLLATGFDVRYPERGCTVPALEPWVRWLSRG